MSIKSRAIAAAAGVGGAGVALAVGLLTGAGSGGATQPGPAPAHPDCVGRYDDNHVGGVHNAAFVKTGEEQLTVGGLLASGAANTC